MFLILYAWIHTRIQISLGSRSSFQGWAWVQRCCSVIAVRVLRYNVDAYPIGAYHVFVGVRSALTSYNTPSMIKKMHILSNFTLLTKETSALSLFYDEKIRAKRL